MEADLLTILPDLSISVVSIAALVYIAHRFLIHLDQRDVRHEAERKETQLTLRELEKEARTSLASTLVTSNAVIERSGQIIERALSVLDKRN